MVRAENRLLTVIAIASAAATAVYLPLAYLAERLMRGYFLSPDARLQIVASVALIPCPLAAWWLFRSLRTSLPLRGSRALAFAFAACSSVCMQPAILRAEDSRMPAARLAGSPLFWVVLFLTVAAMEIAANVIVCVFVLWAFRNAFPGRTKAR
jgi:hypothetical protein